MTHRRNFVELDGRRIDTASQEWRLICLARHICRMTTKVHRHAFLEKLRWSQQSLDELKKLIHQEWERMYPRLEKKETVAHDDA